MLNAFAILFQIIFQWDISYEQYFTNLICYTTFAYVPIILSVNLFFFYSILQLVVEVTIPVLWWFLTPWEITLNMQLKLLFCYFGKQLFI